MMTKYFLTVQIFLLLCTSVAFSQELRPGMTQAGVKSLLGVPGERSKTGQSVERWVYGRSIILFTGGKVAGWSDEGELAAYLGDGLAIDEEEQYQARKRALMSLLEVGK